MDIQKIAEAHRLLSQHTTEQEKKSPLLAAILVLQESTVTWMAKQTMSEEDFAEYLAAANLDSRVADGESLSIEQHLLNLKQGRN